MQPKPKEPIDAICIPRDIVLQAAMMRLGDIDKEVQAGYNIIRKYHKTVTIFGSARTAIDDKYYIAAREVSKKLAAKGYAIISGGGHGIMAAANQGAGDARGDSIGFNITLPHEQTLNEYTTESLAFSHFAPRKIVMTLYADAYIYFPGGFGTLDELTEIITLMQTGKTNKAPIILYGKEFWHDFDTFVHNQLLKDGLISPGDEKIYSITDNIDTIIEHVLTNKTYCDH